MLKELYLVVQDLGAGVSELGNFGFVEASTSEEAIERAKKMWDTTADVFAQPVAALKDGWSYYL